MAIKVMPDDMTGAVTIYSVTSDNGFFVWFVLKILPHMPDSRMLQTRPGSMGQRPSLLPGVALQPRSRLRETPVLPGQEEQALQI